MPVLSYWNDAELPTTFNFSIRSVYADSNVWELACGMISTYGYKTNCVYKNQQHSKTAKNTIMTKWQSQRIDWFYLAGKINLFDFYPDMTGKKLYDYNQHTCKSMRCLCAPQKKTNGSRIWQFRAMHVWTTGKKIVSPTFHKSQTGHFEGCATYTSWL